jgi:hypothetical protein
MWGRGAHSGLVMIGRLKPGVTIQKAAAEMDALYRAVDQANPKQGMPNRLAVVAPLANARISKSSRSLLSGVDITAPFDLRRFRI